MPSVVPKSRRTSRRLVPLVLAAGVACCVTLVALPPLFFAEAPSAAVVERPQGQQQAAAFKGSSRFLKVLLSNADMKALGDVKGLAEIGEKTNTLARVSKKGDYYPWTRRPAFKNKVLILAGEEEAVLEAFKEIRKIVTKDPEIERMQSVAKMFTFLVPTSAAGMLIGTEGENIRAKSDAMDATLSIRRTPMFESQVVVGTEKPDAVDDVAKWLLEEQKEYIEDMRQMLTTVYNSNPGGANGQKSEIFIKLTNKQVSQLIGKGGDMVRFFRDVFRVNIEVDDKVKGPGGTFIVKISGLTGDVHAAHRELLERFVLPKPSPRSSSKSDDGSVAEEDVAASTEAKSEESAAPSSSEGLAAELLES